MVLNLFLDPHEIVTWVNQLRDLNHEVALKNPKGFIPFGESVCSKRHGTFAPVG